MLIGLLQGIIPLAGGARGPTHTGLNIAVAIHYPIHAALPHHVEIPVAMRVIRVIKVVGEPNNPFGP